MVRVPAGTSRRHALRALTFGDLLVHGALTVIPLLAPGAPDPGWLTLAEAGDAVTIEEVSEAGAVPTLRLTSAADRPVLLLDGEELIGLVPLRESTGWPGAPWRAPRWWWRTPWRISWLFRPRRSRRGHLSP